MRQRTTIEIAQLLIEKLSTPRSGLPPVGSWVRTRVVAPGYLTVKVPAGTLGYVRNHENGLAFIAFELPLIDLDGEQWLPGDTMDRRWLASGFKEHEIDVLDDATALAAALTVQHEGDRAKVLAALAQHLQPDLQRDAFEAIRDLAAATGVENRVGILVPLLEALQDNSLHADLYDGAVQTALDVIPQVGNSRRGFTVDQLAPVVPDSVVETLLQVAIAIEEDKWRWSAVAYVAHRLTIEQCHRAWEAVKQIEEQWRCHTRRALQKRLIELTVEANGL